MTTSTSALVTDCGKRVLFRLRGRQYEIGQGELRSILGLPDGPPAVGITVDRDQLTFEFAADDQTLRVSAVLLQRRLARRKLDLKG
ncbi:MAG: hypothetical protein HYX68_29290 [Planctomycetes bacterium]|nr:hypothetical protein [Planctomycetota bacterium]